MVTVKLWIIFFFVILCFPVNETKRKEQGLMVVEHRTIVRNSGAIQFVPVVTNGVEPDFVTFKNERVVMFFTTSERYVPYWKIVCFEVTSKIRIHETFGKIVRFPILRETTEYLILFRQITVDYVSP